MLVLLIGFAGLGTEVTYALLQQRQMQATASAAALGGATALMTGHPSDYTVEVYAEAAAAGFVNGVNGVTVTAPPHPLSGNYMATPGAVEVIVGQPLTLPLSSLFHAGPWNVSARAVALQGNPGGYCVGALNRDPTASGALTIAENGSISSKSCGVAVNSSSSTALIVENNASINGPVSVVGNWSLGNTKSLLNGSPLGPVENQGIPTTTASVIQAPKGVLRWTGSA